MINNIKSQIYRFKLFITVHVTVYSKRDHLTPPWLMDTEWAVKLLCGFDIVKPDAVSTSSETPGALLTVTLHFHSSCHLLWGCCVCERWLLMVDIGLVSCGTYRYIGISIKRSEAKSAEWVPKT